MKSVAVVTVSVAVLFLGTSVLAGAQNGRSKDHEGGNPHHQEGDVRQHEGGHPSPSSHGNHQPHEAEYRHQQVRESHESVQRIPEHRPYGGQLHEVRRSEPAPHYVRQDIWQRQRAHDWQREHRPWHERGGYHGYRIPEDRFRAHFGRGHWFRVHDVPVVVVEGARVSSSEASGLVWLIPARRPGRLSGTGPTMSMSTTSTTDITCTTGSILESPSPSTSRCNADPHCSCGVIHNRLIRRRRRDDRHGRRICFARIISQGGGYLTLGGSGVLEGAV